MGIEQVLLGALTALTGALVWLVKAMNTRSDKLIEQSAAEVRRSFAVLETAVKAFVTFQSDSREFNARVLDRLDKSDTIQSRTLEELQKLQTASTPQKHAG